MEELLRGTTAYRVFSRDAATGRASHAYMLYFNDANNLRSALKLFALELFGAKRGERDGDLILEENFSDCKIYPVQGKKLSASDAGEIVDDCALKPVERDKKLYIISGFEEASAIIQNKLLKVLEEPPEGVYFLLGATSLSPVLSTVKSRVKLLEIPPFTEGEILSALNRASDNPLNAQAAASCAGNLGEAQNMLSGGWYNQVSAAAREIVCADTVEKAGIVALKYGDTKYKNQLLAEMQRQYFEELKKCASSTDSSISTLNKAAYVYALEKISAAIADVKFNANFSNLLYDFALRVIEENDKWKRL
ncbi:MAG: hypothetical protein ACI4L9_01180 [Candidatus Coproplasma sp.]